MDIIDHVVKLSLEVERLRRVVARQMRYGAVAEVDAGRGLARMMISDPDGGTPMMSPWRPWAEVAGQTKTWRPPTAGQQMLLFSPAGDLRQGLMLPATFSDQNQQPSSNGAANRETFGDVTIDMTADGYMITSPLIDLGGAGGRAVARIGDHVETPAGLGVIIEGSSKVNAVD